MDTQVAIIGAGPAGIATALQLKRSGIEPMVFEADSIGGLIRNASLIENYPGFPNGISGSELVRLFIEHLRRASIEVLFEEVLRLDHDGALFVIETKKRTVMARFVVIASGTKPKEFPRIPEYAKARAFYDVLTLSETRQKRIAIVGAGDAAFDYALGLAKRDNRVTLLNRSSRLACLPLLWHRAKKVSNISYYENTVIRGIDNTGDGLLLRLDTVGKSWNMVIDYVIFAIGRFPRLDFVSSTLEVERLESEGLLHLVGDVRRSRHRQTAIAVGDGIEAAMRIYQKLKEEAK